MNHLVNQNTRELIHHGVIGQKWGVRRYQPYGEGGYDPKKPGRFVGKQSRKQQKENYKELKKLSKQRGYTSGTAKSELMKNFMTDERIGHYAKAIKKEKSAFERHTGSEERTERELRKVLNKTSKDDSKYKESLAKTDELEERYNKARAEGTEALGKEAKKYIDDMLGKYAYKSVKQVLDVHPDLKDVMEMDSMTFNGPIGDLLLKDIAIEISVNGADVSGSDLGSYSRRRRRKR